MARYGPRPSIRLRGKAPFSVKPGRPICFPGPSVGIFEEGPLSRRLMKRFAPLAKPSPRLAKTARRAGPHKHCVKSFLRISWGIRKSKGFRPGRGRLFFPPLVKETLFWKGTGPARPVGNGKNGPAFRPLGGTVRGIVSLQAGRTEKKRVFGGNLFPGSISNRRDFCPGAVRPGGPPEVCGPRDFFPASV